MFRVPCRFVAKSFFAAINDKPHRQQQPQQQQTTITSNTNINAVCVPAGEQRRRRSSGRDWGVLRGIEGLREAGGIKRDWLGSCVNANRADL